MLVESAIALVERIAPPPPASAPVAERQSGVIPYAIVESTPVFLLVTSRQRGRWIFPKGRIADGLKPWESAEREAHEEAGVEGVIATRPVGSYRAWKTRGVRRFVIEVDMYPLRVEKQHDNWRETGERYRHWVTLAEATRLITDKRVAELLRNFARHLRVSGDT
ncbi:MAG: NUDIX hydrolase [Bauldia sp.]|uniref:NUDIX hydrolase n=1 Tax=Bauldia sp. TaxID=2575872 RepID=UPI001DC5A309|nr:NUDIX hydrolase [Bauldia sp.]MCB1497036.1 NUDIX hydrolase [Bauldia sp.]